MDEPVRRIGSLGDDDQDPDMAPVQPSEKTTHLDGVVARLEQALTQEVTFEPVTVQIAKRPGVSVRYRTELNDEQLAAWRKRSEDRKAPSGMNTLRFCLMILANQCDALLFNDQEARDEAGQSLTYAHARIRKLYSANRAADCARKAIASDPHVMLHANAILDAAGFGDQAVEVEGEDTPFDES
jgi:hypothetical protein